MKKFMSVLLALVLLLVPVLSMAEAAPATFDFTAEEFVEGYSKFCSDMMTKEIVWSEPMEVETMVAVTGSSEGMNDVIVYNMVGETACVGVYAEFTTGISDSDMTAKAQAFGMTVAAVPFATRYMESGYDVAVMKDEISEIETACQELVQKVFSSDAITSAMTEPYTETAVIGGHNATMTLSMSLEDMTMTVAFTYVK